MKHFTQFLLAPLVATVGLASFPAVAGAFGISFVNDDLDFNALNPNLAFVAEGRIGNNAPDVTHELNFHGINDPTATSGQADYVWTNGVSTVFKLMYDATTRNISYQVGDTILNSIANENLVSDIFIRVRATVSESSIAIANLVFNGTPISQSLAIAGTSNWSESMEYLRISGFTDSFSLEGTSLMSWGNTLPKNSNLAYQIKVGNAEAVPEPLSILGLGLGASGLAFMKKRRQRSA
ncbi:choice-of-anchor W domain-containing protein [Oscillatoria acuminata]|uniref:PEP-CTERM putative exosortase interaction domain-containing protein n=1 Tax=Oscillatoria acuminata PCC 6304 TaxID=56110 RepID=K9TIZ1_9CYAN|nr:choice-of-anchor W domain-containing protein [Oscillatoria acuminata]AFY82792.1 PEP-CTERM putative exosortase interaction domain-containing protein [Oscillatoria acuminata PCC 6304]